MASTTDTDTAGTDPGPAKAELPLGTPPAFEGMHRKIRRVCYVLLFALVIEGALTFPLLAIWYGFPELSPKEICSELQGVAYSDDGRECETHSFPQPPLRGPTEVEEQTTSEDRWGVQPDPGYDSIEFRELIEQRDEREADQEDDQDQEDRGDDEDGAG
jgi:hypothetical protein